MKTILLSMPKWLFRFATLWAIFAGLIIFFYAGASSVSATSESEVPVVQHLNWYESQGWWGVATLFIFAALYYGPLRFYNRGQRGMVAVFGLVAAALTVLAGFSIGFFYLPAAMAVLIGLLAIPIQGILGK